MREGFRWVESLPGQLNKLHTTTVTQVFICIKTIFQQMAVK